MKKINNKGFMIVETLIVSVMVLTSLVLIYTQLKTVNNSYDFTFKYNTVNSLYLSNEAKKFIKNNIKEELMIALENDSKNYIDISTCSSDYFINDNYCINLFSSLNIKKILFTNENVISLKEKLKEERYLDENMISFINYIKYDDLASTYRIVIEFLDNTYASVKIV